MDMKTVDIVFNMVIFAAAPVILFCLWLREGKDQPGRMKNVFRFFTCQSNVLCSVSALGMAVARLVGDVPQWVWILKYIGTAAVTVTMLTVILFLAPSVGKNWYEVLLKGPSNLFMHLLTPLLAIVSFCVFEKRGMSFAQSLWGLLPLVVYGPHYLYRVVYAPEGKGWEDFYGFNKQGKWPVSFVLMFAGAFVICMGFMLVQNA